MKKNVSIAVAATAVATLAGAENAHADQVTDAQSNNVVVTPSNEVANQETLNQAKEAQKKAEQNKADADLQVKSAEQDVKSSQDATKQAQDQLSKNNVDAKQKQAELDAAKQAEQNAKDAINNQADNLAQAQKDAAKQDDVVAQKQTQTDAAQKQADETKTANKQAQTEKQANDAKADAAQKKQNQAQTELDNVKKAPSIDAAQKQVTQNQKQVDDATKIAQQKDAANKSAQQDLADKKAKQTDLLAKQKDAKAKLDKTPKQLVEKNPNKVTRATPTDKAGDAKNAQLIGSDAELPLTLKEPKELATGVEKRSGDYANWYFVDKNRDKSAKLQVKNGRMDINQQRELAQYSLTLINAYRKQNGLPPLIMTEKTWQAIMDAQLTLRDSDDKYVDQHSRTKANPTDLFRSGTAQNIGFGNAQTMLEAKVEIANYLTAMAYKDLDSANGHHDALLMPVEKGHIIVVVPMVDYVGSKGAHGQWNYVTDFIDYADMDLTGDPVTPEEAAKSVGMDQVIPEVVDTNDDNETITRDNPAYAQAQAEYDQLTTELNAANTAVTEAQATATKTQTEATQANADLAQAQAQANLTQAQSALKAAQTKLAEAKHNQAAAKDALDAAKQAVKDAQAKVDQDRLNKDGGLEIISPDEDKANPQVPNESRPDAKQDGQVELPSEDTDNISTNGTHVESETPNTTEKHVGVQTPTDVTTPKTSDKDITSKKVPTPSTQMTKSEKQLPNTGSSQTGLLTILGSLLFASVSGLWFRKRQ
ncbi:SEC10/PgrA surface exclusion domain-containing protein [Weissella viridescens]|uniref:SEC10/PgrA surface exclusion domain-containing protein n=1 Tax=Weissella viridescens TaxID=1629 RepID=UPI003AF27CC0